jgi:hypothetical protein
MAYSGTTAASSLSNPPRRLIGGVGQITNSTGLTTAPTAAPGGQGGAVWVYTSTNLTTDLVVSNFFSDGYYLGMRPGDLVMGSQFSSGWLLGHHVLGRGHWCEHVGRKPVDGLPGDLDLQLIRRFSGCLGVGVHSLGPFFT